MPLFRPIRASPLDSCPDPSNLKDDFREMLAVKKKNRAQVVVGPVFSKTTGDGFLDKNNLTALGEDEVDDAITKILGGAAFSVTIIKAEKRMARVRFGGLDGETQTKRLLASWRQLRDEFSMWASPDQPIDLSKMTVNAKRFGIALRENSSLPTTSYVDVQDGVLYIGAIRIAPVYLIPDKEQWPKINGIVESQIKDYLALPWTIRNVKGASSDMVKRIWDAVWKDV
jgi:hypothetical protein